MLKKSPPAIHEVSVLFKTHLDIGFTDLAATVIRRYLEDYIPAALDLARRTRHLPHRFVWTTGAWLAWKYLEESAPERRRLMEEGIEAGDFTWHALPFTTHTELMDKELFEHGLRYSQLLDKRFGRVTTGAKMTDVPGHTRAMIPLLAQAGVRFLHIGVNPASTVPDVPPAFVWRAEGADLVVVYEKQYGGVAILPDGLALSVNLTGDNLGPENPNEVDRIYRNLKKRYPGAVIRASGFEHVADWLWARKDRLPVVTSEIGDTWIHGVGTDPGKVAQFRELSRLRNRWIAKGQLVKGSKQEIEFNEQLLMVAEHTWGLDVKTHLAQWHCYNRKAVSNALGTARFLKVQASWDEQRDYLRNAVANLPGFLRQNAADALSILNPVLRNRNGCTSVPVSEAITLGEWKLAFHSNGAIRLLQKAGSDFLATPKHRLASLCYQTYSAADYERFYRQYNRLDVDWARQDFTKPGLPPSSISRRFEPQLKSLSVYPGSERATVELVFPPEARNFGAPALVLLELVAAKDGVDMRLEWFEKQANRMPEALWLNFNPHLLEHCNWRLKKMGHWIDFQDVARNGNRQLHAVDDKVEAGRFSLTSLDAPLVAPGWGSLLNFHNRQPSFGKGISFNLYNNVWGTNFPMWYSEDAVFRFELRWGAGSPVESPGRPHG